MKEELLPCPFCGSELVGYEFKPDLTSLKMTYMACCLKCPAKMEYQSSKAATAKQWNTRVESAELAQLREKLAAERDRREELEVVAAGLYLNHEEARHQMMMYKAVYIDGNDVLKEGMSDAK